MELRTTIAFSDNSIVRRPEFSPNGKWIAIVTQEVDERYRASGRDPDVEDLPQPEVHLIEAATGELREIIISPQAIAVCACFSPDGKTSATGGSGRIHLWDMSNRPVAVDGQE